MEVYLVTFYFANGFSFSTIIKGENLEDIKKQVYEKIRLCESSFSHFKVKDTLNRFFTVNWNNVDSIEYEYLTFEMGFSFKDLIKLDSDTLRILLGHIPNEYLLVNALYHSNEELSSFFVNVLSEEKKHIYLESRRVLKKGYVRLEDSRNAQESIVELAFRLHKEKVISISEIISISLD